MFRMIQGHVNPHIYIKNLSDCWAAVLLHNGMDENCAKIFNCML